MTAVKLRWYFRKTALVLIFLSAGPLVLPLIWLHPEFSRRTKAVLTAVVLILSYLALVTSMRFVSGLREEFRQIIQQG